MTKHRFDWNEDRCVCGGVVVYFEDDVPPGEGCEVEGHPWRPITVRVSPTVRGFLEGTGAYQSPDLETELGDALAVAVVGRIMATSSERVDLGKREAAVLLDYAEAMEAASRDDAHVDPTARGELNAARALIRNLRKAGVTWEEEAR